MRDLSFSDLAGFTLLFVVIGLAAWGIRGAYTGDQRARQDCLSRNMQWVEGSYVR